jgi:hypothetical protein
MVGKSAAIMAAAALFIAVDAQGHGIESTHHGRAAADPVSWIEHLIGARAAATQRIDSRNGFRFITSDGLPNHATGAFPNRGNPHSIRKQDFTYRVPLRPTRADRVRLLGHADFGVALNGIPFDPATAEFWNRDRRSGWNFEAIGGSLDLGLDQNNAHVQPDGSYHYHGIPTGLVKSTNYRSRPKFLGYAADGFPIYAPYGYRDPDNPESGMKELQPSFRLRQGERRSGPGGRYDGRFARDFEYAEGLGDLDRCNGRIGVTPEYPKGTYYYVLTEAFPFIPRCWVGTPDDSFQKYPGNPRGIGEGTGTGRQPGSGPGGGPRGGPGGGGPPREAIQACVSRQLGDACSFRAPVGQVDGVCRAVNSGEKACVPRWHGGNRPGAGARPGAGGRRDLRGLGPLPPG